MISMGDIIEALKVASSATLLNMLKSIDGKKDLILDAEMISSLDYIAKVQQLKACEVEKIFKLEPGASPGITTRCIYLVRSNIENTRIIADHIKVNRSAIKPNEYWIIYVPRRWFLCDMVLEREGVYGYAKILEFPLGLLPIDTDMLSLEIPDFFPSCFLQGNQIHLHTVAMSLVQLQKLCGCIPKVFGHGRYSNMAVSIMKTLMEETETGNSGTGNISYLIMFDRDVDFVSVLLTQLTYEGLLDETFDIKSGSISFGKEATGQDQPVKIILNNEESIFSSIRNCHFTSVLGILKGKAQQLQIKHDKSNLSLDDMKQIVAHKKKNVQQERLLPLYIHTCEVIIKQKNVDFQKQMTTENNLIDGIKLKECQTFIEDAINMQVPLCTCLRLLCLLSITQDGLFSRDYKSLVVQFLQSYGHKHMITLQNLKKIGLFVEQVPLTLPVSVPMSGSSGAAAASKLAGKVAAAVASFPRQSSFKVMARKMFLVPNAETVQNLKSPSDMSYVFSGAYIPLIGKLTEQIIQNDGFNKLEDAMKLLPGPTISLVNSLNQSDNSNKVILVYVLGGVTYAEVAALRFLARSKGEENWVLTCLNITTGHTLSYNTSDTLNYHFPEVAALASELWLFNDMTFSLERLPPTGTKFGPCSYIPAFVNILEVFHMCEISPFLQPDR